MDYVIKNHKNVYIKLNQNGKAITCSESERGTFEESKAKNIIGSLPKTLKRLNFKVEPIPDIGHNRKVIEEKTLKEKTTFHLKTLHVGLKSLGSVVIFLVKQRKEKNNF